VLCFWRWVLRLEAWNEEFGGVTDGFCFSSVLLAWVLTNGLLGAAITSTNSKASLGGANNAVKGYMSFLLASVAGLAFVRFVGSSTYMIIRLFAGE